MLKTLIVCIIFVSLFAVGCDVYETLYASDVPGDTEQVPESVLEGSGDEAPVIDEDNALNEPIAVIEEEVLLDEDVEDVEDIVTMDEELSDAEPIVAADAAVVIVEETQLVDLEPQAEDPDEDVVAFAYTTPLNDEGQWQTTYGDAGEYTVTVSASDGELTSTKDVLLIVNKREEPPTIDSAVPAEVLLEVEETDTVRFSVRASDLNDDALSYEWKLDGVGVGDGASYTYDTSYDDSGAHTVKVSVSDDASVTDSIWSVTVTNLNRLPRLQLMDDIIVSETETVTIVAEASDEDGDAIQYDIDDTNFNQVDNVFSWDTTYNDAGVYLVTVSATDGEDTVEQEVQVTVENVNRPPVILDIVQKS